MLRNIVFDADDRFVEKVNLGLLRKVSATPILVNFAHSLILAPFQDGPFVLPTPSVASERDETPREEDFGASFFEVGHVILLLFADLFNFANCEPFCAGLKGLDE